MDQYKILGALYTPTPNKMLTLNLLHALRLWWDSRGVVVRNLYTDPKILGPCPFFSDSPVTGKFPDVSLSRQYFTQNSNA